MDIERNIGRVLIPLYFLPDSIPEYMMDILASKETAAAYLAAMIDGEGSISYVPPPQSVRTIKITNTNLALLELCRRAYDLLDIKHWTKSQTFSNPNWAPCFDLCVSGRENLKRFREVIPVQHPDKKQKLDLILSSYRYGNSLGGGDGTKECTKCNKIIPLDQFSNRTDRMGKKKSHCRTCVNDYHRGIYRR